MRCVVCGVWCVLYMVCVWRETVLGGRVCVNVNVNVSMYVHLEGVMWNETAAMVNTGMTGYVWAGYMFAELQMGRGTCVPRLCSNNAKMTHPYRLSW